MRGSGRRRGRRSAARPEAVTGLERWAPGWRDPDRLTTWLQYGTAAVLAVLFGIFLLALVLR